MDKVRPILDLNAFVFDQSTVPDKELAELIKLRYKTQGPTSMLFYQEPLHIVRGGTPFRIDCPIRGTVSVDTLLRVVS